ncbi:MAG: SpoIIE family protein phosphatase [SAR324 cluster bacterium]|nr:SpoIIE family protein phosphatase [SAR324 cluster bacterium]
MSQILVVDDDFQIFQQVRLHLSQAGHQLSFVSVAKHVFNRLEKDPFDLILMDINMPEMDGITLLRELQRNPDFSSIPVIMLTAEISDLLLAECFRWGAVDYVNKPVRELVLKARVNSALAARLTLNELERRVAERTEDLQYRIQLESIVSSISTQFITISTQEIDAAINHSLETLARHIGASSCFFLNLLPNGDLAQLYEWHDTAFEPFCQCALKLGVREFLIRTESRESSEKPLFEVPPSAGKHIPPQSNILTIPIIYEGEVTGFFGCENPQKFTTWKDEDIRQFHVIGSIFASALQRKQHEKDLLLIKEKEAELKMAAALQMALFPKSNPEIPRVRVATWFQSASETGGDWYGFMTSFENYLFILIGDVTGHGAPAAMVTATVCSACRTLEKIWSSQNIIPTPGALLEQLNSTVFESGSPDYHMTFLAARIHLDDLLLTVSNAGHNFPVLIRSSNEIKPLVGTNSPLGYQVLYQFSETTFQLQRGDKLLFYTDGLIENQNSQGEEWGNRNLKRCMREGAALTVDGLVNGIVKKLQDFLGNQPLNDDITLSVCELF